MTPDEFKRTAEDMEHVYKVNGVSNLDRETFPQRCDIDARNGLLATFLSALVTVGGHREFVPIAAAGGVWGHARTPTALAMLAPWVDFLEGHNGKKTHVRFSNKAYALWDWRAVINNPQPGTYSADIADGRGYADCPWCGKALRMERVIK